MFGKGYGPLTNIKSKHTNYYSVLDKNDYLANKYSLPI